MLSIPHLIVIFVVVLVLFGPQKLPELARGLGKLMAEFRKASLDFRSAFEDEMRDLERQARLAELRKQEAGTSPAAAPASLPPAGESAATGEALAAPEDSGSASTEEAVPRSAGAEPPAEAPASPTENTIHDHQ